MINYITHDGAGNLTGAYQQDPHPDHVGFLIECTEEERRNWVLYRGIQVEAQIGENVIPAPEDSPEFTPPSVEPIMGLIWMLELLPPTPYNLPAAKSALIANIDRDADSVYGAVIGNRATEYTMADTDARAYAAAGYNGDAPVSIQCWADVKGQTAEWAANDILATAAAWKAAQSSIRASRLAHKESVRNAANKEALEIITASWAGFVVTIRTALGVV